MRIIKSMYLCPPDGKEYGFPKKFVPEQHRDVIDWLVNNGYPIKRMTYDMPLAMTNVVYYENGHGDNMEPII